jgi:hypothetical protein
MNRIQLSNRQVRLLNIIQGLAYSIIILVMIGIYIQQQLYLNLIRSGHPQSETICIVYGCSFTSNNIRYNFNGTSNTNTFFSYSNQMNTALYEFSSLNSSIFCNNKYNTSHLIIPNEADC